MFQVAFGSYSVTVQNDTLPELYSNYQTNAQLVFEHELASSDGKVAFCSVTKSSDDWPFFTAAFRYTPAGIGFNPGVLIVPETNYLFLGAGTKIFVFDLDEPKLLVEDTTDFGFWSWRRHGKTILMSAELELAAWNLDGHKLWTSFVEPPWSYEVKDNHVELDIMGENSRFLIEQGPPLSD